MSRYTMAETTITIVIIFLIKSQVRSRLRRIIPWRVGIWYGGISIIKGALGLLLSTVRLKPLATPRAMIIVMVDMKNMATPLQPAKNIPIRST